MFIGDALTEELSEQLAPADAPALRLLQTVGVQPVLEVDTARTERLRQRTDARREDRRHLLDALTREDAARFLELRGIDVRLRVREHLAQLVVRLAANVFDVRHFLHAREDAL
jgi:hypothetical protein